MSDGVAWRELVDKTSTDNVVRMLEFRVRLRQCECRVAFGAKGQVYESQYGNHGTKRKNRILSAVDSSLLSLSSWW